MGIWDRFAPGAIQIEDWGPPESIIKARNSLRIFLMFVAFLQRDGAKVARPN